MACGPFPRLPTNEQQLQMQEIWNETFRIVGYGVFLYVCYAYPHPRIVKTM